MPSMHLLLRVVEHVTEVFKLELIPTWQLLATLGVANGTNGILTLLEPILPLLDLLWLMEVVYLCRFGFGAGVEPSIVGVRAAKLKQAASNKTQ